MWLKLAKQIKPEIHSSSIIGLHVDYEVGKELFECVKKIKNPETIDSYHITLIYLGKIKDLENKKDKILKVLENFASKNSYIKGKIDGYDCFEPSESSNNKIPLYAVYKSNNIIEIRNKLLEELKTIGVENASDFKDYKPHITLKYLDNEKEIDQIKSPKIDCNFYKIGLFFGNSNYEYFFKQD